LAENLIKYKKERTERSKDGKKEILKQSSLTVVTESKTYFVLSVSRFQEKEKRGEMITINDNIK
jgi:hypothetical protein